MEELGCQKEPGSVERYGGALSWLSTVSLIVFFFFVGINALTLLFCTIYVQVQLPLWFFEVAFIYLLSYVFLDLF